MTFFSHRPLLSRYTTSAQWGPNYLSQFAFLPNYFFNYLFLFIFNRFYSSFILDNHFSS